MTVLRVLEYEALALGVTFGLSYCAISLVLWHLSRSSERRIRARAAESAASSKDRDATS